VQRPLTILISGAGIAGPTVAYWLVRRGHRPVLVERTPELRVGGHAVDIRGTALEVIERMGLDTAVRDARTRILTLSAVRPDGVRTYDVALRPMHEARGDREIEIMRDDLVHILFGAVSDDVEVVFGDPAAQHDVLRTRFAGMGWHTGRLVESLADAYDFYFDEMSQVRLPRWSAGRVALLGDAAFGPSPMSGQGTSLALIGAFLLAHHLAEGSDPVTAFGLWEKGFRPNVELNQALATDGMSTLLPASRFGIFTRNQMMRALPLLARFGLGFGGRIERASRAVTLPR
jgi:2-polyprenyl-6-methoxyphenol hydroxylase-like FAD-dependent oxidoreductase